MPCAAASAVDDAYAVLEVGRDASADEIRRAYHRLARQYHPDAAGGAADSEAFDRVQRAWEQLRESDVREAHDAGLRVQELTGVQSDSRVSDVDLDDMEYSEDATGAGVWRLGCRCGDTFVLHEDDLASGVGTLQCCSCSLSIRPLYSAAAPEE